MIFALTVDVVLIYGTSLPGVGSGVETGIRLGSSGWDCGGIKIPWRTYSIYVECFITKILNEKNGI